RPDRPPGAAPPARPRAGIRADTAVQCAGRGIATGPSSDAEPESLPALARAMAMESQPDRLERADDPLVARARAGPMLRAPHDLDFGCRRIGSDGQGHRRIACGLDDRDPVALEAKPGAGGQNDVPSVLPLGDPNRAVLHEQHCAPALDPQKI